jgi:hypothetical protein
MSSPIIPSGLEALADSRTGHLAAAWNARRALLAMEAHEVDGTVYSGPRGHELGPRLQDLWAAEAGQLLGDLVTAIRCLAPSAVLDFEQRVHDAVHQAAMLALPTEEPEPADAAGALVALRDEETGVVTTIPAS